MGRIGASSSEAIAAIYDAILDAELWRQAFAAIGRQVGGDQVIFFTPGMNANRMRFVTGSESDPSILGVSNPR